MVNGYHDMWNDIKVGWEREKMGRVRQFCIGISGFAMVAASLPAMADPAASWVDPTTGHKVIRISTEPGMASLYFHQNSYTPQGDKMVITTAKGIAAIDLKTWRISPIVDGTGLRLLFVGRKTPTAYYAVKGSAPAAAANADGQTQATEIWAVDIGTRKRRKITEIAGGSIDSINSDETLLVGQVAERAMPLQPGTAGRDPRFDQANYQVMGPDGKPRFGRTSAQVRGTRGSGGPQARGTR